jgi:hypothetical protein
MFLKELYFNRRKTFFLFVFFLILTFFVNYKSGAIITPVNLFGMFAGGFKIADTQTVYRLVVNDSFLDYTKYSYFERDLMLVLVGKYDNQAACNKAVFNTIKSSFSKVGLGAIMKEENFSNKIDDIAFTNWYKIFVQKIVGYPVKKLELYKQNYIWNSEKLIPQGAPQKQNFIVAN